MTTLNTVPLTSQENAKTSLVCVRSAARREELRFQTIEGIVAEAKRLAAGDVRTTGNHSFAGILEHLARSFEMCTGKLTPPRPPFMVRLMMPFIKPMLFNDKPLKPGIKLSPESESVFWPPERIDVQQALSHLEEAIAGYQQVGPISVHPIFGKLTREQHDLINRKHAALHLSFVHAV